ncbi:MAG: hypothetical protein V1698_01630 [bacterium]
MVEVRKREKESNESLLRRFSRKVQQSGLLLKARRIRFREQVKSKSRLREDAIRRSEMQKQRDYLKKIGKLKETTRFGSK